MSLVTASLSSYYLDSSLSISCYPSPSLFPSNQSISLSKNVLTPSISLYSLCHYASPSHHYLSQPLTWCPMPYFTPNLLTTLLPVNFFLKYSFLQRPPIFLREKEFLNGKKSLQLSVQSHYCVLASSLIT